MNRWIRSVVTLALWSLLSAMALADTKTWDGKWDTSKLDVTVVYFVPADRKPLRDWKDRVDYFCRRIEQFHGREFQGQSTLRTIVRPEPLISELKTSELRQGNANAIFFRTLQESDRRLKFAQGEREAFPILLVLSEINWQPLDDFYRLKPAADGYNFEGQNIGGQHFPGAAAGGARATYLADRGIGWGLVSADGWRVPYRGSDCVIYHEGCGHTVGLPHPEPVDGSVMGVAQYQGWINESFLNKEQKIRLNWEPKNEELTSQQRLFDAFTAIPEPLVPKPGETVVVRLTWPDQCAVKSLRVRYQTSIDGPWIESAQPVTEAAPTTATVGVFDRPTPLSYRVDATLVDGSSAELWGYLQVRPAPEAVSAPDVLPLDLIIGLESDSSTMDSGDRRFSTNDEVDLLARIKLEDSWSQGDWKLENGILTSPKMYGSRLELPYTPETDYQILAIVEPLDEPNGLILGQRMGPSRFVTLFNYKADNDTLSAIENVDGQNVGNSTTTSGSLFQKGRLSQVIVTVRNKGVTMSVDGQIIADWRGSPDQLSLSDYWATPNQSSLFIGAYDCRYRVHRLAVTPAKT
jgi:hypothetical protein